MFAEAAERAVSGLYAAVYIHATVSVKAVYSKCVKTCLLFFKFFFHFCFIDSSSLREGEGRETHLLYGELHGAPNFFITAVYCIHDYFLDQIFLISIEQPPSIQSSCLLVLKAEF